MPQTTWSHLPTELHLAIVRFMSQQDTRALSCTSRVSYSLYLPQIFATVIIPTRRTLRSFVMHVPSRYGALIRHLTVCTKSDDGAVDLEVTCTEDLATLLATCSSLFSLSLSLAGSLNASTLAPVFATLATVHQFEIGCWGQEEAAPVSERIAVLLAASLPSLTHLTLSRITRSALHVGTCTLPGVPLVLNDYDVPSHRILGDDLCITSLLKLPSLKSLDMKDVWIDCDENMDVQERCGELEHISISGSMYRDVELENKACLAWLRACGPSLRSLKTGISLADPYNCTGRDLMALEEEPIVLPLPIISDLHVDAERVALDELVPMLNVLAACEIKQITIANATMCAAQDAFARECASDEFEEWQDGIEYFLRNRSEDWGLLKHVELDFGQGTFRIWNL